MKKHILLLAVAVVAVLSSFNNTNEPGSYSNFKQSFLNLINKTRQKGCNCGDQWFAPAPPLVWNDELEKAAHGHAKDMASKKYFSHTSKDGRSMSDRIVFAGYYFKGYKSFTVGENIAWGQNSIEEVMSGWFKSEGHCRNLMNPDFKEVGVAEKDEYWVQDFGGRESFSPEQQRLIKSGKYRLIQKEPVSGH
ncbi:CAP domain-containing protein [Inquilinus sp. KBS0705]|nr:CAP domain-containing protein [Inquilinus sp. KBS0705]